ncbi:MAG: hypothetical protein ACJ8LI_02170, partial [Chthoniobacterales bacterium]
MKSGDEKVAEQSRLALDTCERSTISLSKGGEPGARQMGTEPSHNPAKGWEIDGIEINTSGAEL